MQERGAISVFDSTFYVSSGIEANFASGSFANGLARVLDTGGVAILTGISHGTVIVDVEGLLLPPVAQAEQWDDIVEVSINAPLGTLQVGDTRSFDSYIEANLCADGPGHYRIRVHCRGRDLDYDKVADPSRESYLIVAWPATPASESIIRATDAAGLSYRISAEAVGDIPVIGDPNAMPADKARREERLRRATE